NDGKILEFETRGRYSNSESGLGIKIGNIFYGSEGYLEIDGSTWRAYRNKESDPFAGSKVIQANASETLTGSSNTEHFVNFLDAIKSGNNETLHCDILDGHYSSAVPFLANISYRLGREIRFMGNSEKCINDPAADAMLTRKYRSPYVVPSKV
ncbi:MAG: dehydrogenase, partial [Sphingobacteriia bacterium 35-40-5]